MNMRFRLATMSALCILLLASCDKKPYDPAQDPNKNYEPPKKEEQKEDPKDPEPETPKPEYVVDEYGYATYEYGGFTYKFKQEVIDKIDAKSAMKKIKADIDVVNSLLPEAALEVLRPHPIWLEEKNMKDRDGNGAAWCHNVKGNGLYFGGLEAKDFCVEITNYKNYVSWSNQNQPLMVLHEMCHLYHALALGGEKNEKIKNAYNNAKSKGLYTTTYYRYNTKDPKSKWITVTDAYCMVTMWEYFSEMCEAYFGENDYYPFNYEQLKEHDPVAFDMCEQIWGSRTEQQ